MKTYLRFGVIVLVALSTSLLAVWGASLSATKSIAGSDLSARAKAAIEGNWRLVEWYENGTQLAPAHADGRQSLHDGRVTILMHRDHDGVRKSYYGYGTYSLGAATYTYGYERYVVFTDTGSGITAGPGPFTGNRTYEVKSEGEKLVFEFDHGRWKMVFVGDTWTYLDNGQVLRKWRKITE